MDLDPFYSPTGATCTVTAGSAAVTFAGTALQGLVNPGDKLFVGGLGVPILTVSTSAQSLTLAANWPGATATKTSPDWYIEYTPDAVELQGNLRKLLTTIGASGNVAAIGALTAAADKFIRFTGAGTATLDTVTAFARTLLDDPDLATLRGTLGLDSRYAQLGTNTFAGASGSALLRVDGSFVELLFRDASNNAIGGIAVGGGAIELFATTAGGTFSEVLSLKGDGTITLSGPTAALPVSVGGTGGTTAAAARTALGALAVGGAGADYAAGGRASVGAIALCTYNGATSLATTGATTAGSNLTYSSVASGQASGPTGTWQVMGFCEPGGKSLFQRIA